MSANRCCTKFILDELLCSAKIPYIPLNFRKKMQKYPCITGIFHVFVLFLRYKLIILQKKIAT